MTKRIDILKVICYGFVLAVLSIRFFFLDKGFIISDEGWFIYLLRDRPILGSSQFHMLLFGIFGGNIFYWRLLLYFIRLGAAVILSLGFFKWLSNCDLKYRQIPFSVILAIVFAGQLKMDGFNPNSNELTFASIEAAVGLLFLASSMKCKNLCMCLAGFFAMMVFFIKITGIIVIPCLILIIVTISEQPKRDILLFSIGGVLAFLFFFVFVESPSLFISSFLEQFDYTLSRGNHSYGPSRLLLDLKKIVEWYLILFAIGAAIFFVYRGLKEKYKGWLVIFSLFLCTLILQLINTGFFPLGGIKPKAPYIVYWALASTFIWLSDNRQKTFLCLLLLFIPAFLSFGTKYIDHFTRETLFFVTIPILFLSRNKLHYFLLVLVIVFNFSLFVHSTKGYNWADYKWLEQTEDIRTLGIRQHIYVDKKDYALYKYVKSITEEGDECLCDHSCWGFVPMCGLKSVKTNFYLSESEAYSIIEEHIQSSSPFFVFLNSRKRYEYEEEERFIDDFIDNLKNDNRFDCTRFGIDSLYYCFRYSPNH